MFGKKKAASGGSKSKSKSKPVKQGHSVNFFAAHAEKLILGIVVFALGYLVYEGVGGEGYDPKRQPTELSQTADTLLQSIRNGDPWPELEKERTIVHDFAQRTEQARLPSNPDLYPVPVMEVQDKGAYQKRGDPELAAPVKVIGQSVVGLIAVEAPENAIDPFEDFEDAKKLEGKKRQSNRNTRAAPAMGSSGSAGSSGMGSADTASMTPGYPGMAGDTGPLKRIFPPEFNKGFPVAGATGMGGYGSEASSTMMSGSGASGGMMSGSGFGAPAGTLSGAPTIKPKKTLAVPIFFNAVTALVEHDALVKEYDAKLRESASFMLPRDMPLYLSFEVQRVEITKVDQKIEENDWQKVTDGTQQLIMMKDWLPKYPQRVPDVIDPMAFDQALTMPIPPMLIQDYRRFTKHPDIDWIWDAGMQQMAIPMPDPTLNLPDPSEGVLPGDLPTVGGMGMGMGGSMGSMDSGSGYGMGYGMGGSGELSGGMGSGYGSMGSMGSMGSGYGGGMASGSEMGGYGMGGYGMDSYGMGAAMMPTKYKMIRFYDKLKGNDVRKTFKYRVRVMLEDPNYPSDKFPAPRSSDLQDDVFARVAKLRQKEDPEAEAARKENLKLRANAKPRIYNRTKRFTPWSEPSNSIYVRGTEDVYFGKFRKKGNDEVDGVLVKLDTSKGAYVPMYSFVTEDNKEDKKVPTIERGVVLIYDKLTTQFVHPITMVIKTWKDYSDFKGWSTVVDIRGNDPLALSDKDDPLTEIGEVMLLMGDGRVEVTNEYDDAFWYRAFTFADEREAAENSAGAIDAAAMSGYGGAP